ncbi:hypothetical protein BBP40_011810 [Aspergillus hancockii]|nr:hypothetical protein BBP40_011810 [Aspergillus hancockii]
MLEHFLLDPDWKNFNHGAYGTYPKVVRDELRKFQDVIEARPDKFIRHLYPESLNISRSKIAHYLNVPVNEIVFVKSATVAINTVLRNLTFNPQDTIIYFSTIFDACEKTIKSVQETTPLNARKIEVSFPITHDEIVARFLETIEQTKQEGFTVRIALFDTISSVPGVRFPFEKLTRICREQNILSCVDGAHVRNQHLIRTTIPTSHGFVPRDHPSLPEQSSSHAPKKSRFELLFQDVAITDDTPYLTVPAALNFRAQVPGGEEGVFTYIREIAFKGGNLVARVLGTEVLGESTSNGDADKPCRARNCAFANVRLPVMISSATPGENPGEIQDGLTGASDWPFLSPDQAVVVARWIQERLVDEYSTSLTVFLHNSALWTRISGQIYLEVGDFEWLGGVLKELCDRVGKDLDDIVR